MSDKEIAIVADAPRTRDQLVQMSYHGLHLIGHFPSDRWGDFMTYFRFKLGSDGKIERLDIGQQE